MGVNTYATPKPPGLLDKQAGKVTVELPEQALFGKSQNVKINYGKLRSGRFFVDLPGDVSFEAVRDVEYDFGGGKSAWVGRVNGDAKSRVVLGKSGKALAGTFAVGDRLFKLEPRANGGHVLSEVKPTDPAPELDPIPVADVAGAADASVDAAAAADGGSTIDVLVAYTPKIASIYGSAGAEALVIQAVAEANQAYANSGVTARLNLVQAVLTDYVESSSMNTDLSRLRATNDGYLDELHSLRDQYGADLVSLIADQPGYCGLAYRMTSLSTGFASSAFSLVHRTCATGYYSFAHELGHNQGLHHDPANASGAIYPYAYGYQEPFNAFRTVMAYNCSGGCTRVSQFSNPNVLYNGQPTGADNASDNARTLNTTAATVASFRAGEGQIEPPPTPEVPPSAPGSLDAATAGSSAISLSWSDNSNDESGFKLERSADGVNFSEIASLQANSTRYQDDNLAPDTLYSYRARAWSSVGNSGYSNIATAATDTPPPFIEQLATADAGTIGSRNGTYQDTWTKNGVSERITERLSGKRKNKARYGYLQHTWSFNIAASMSTVLTAKATTDASTDTFTFAYSTDNQQWVNMFTVSDSTSGELQFYLPAGISGTVYIRVKDNVRDVNEPTSYSVQIDYLMIRSENGTGEALPLPSAPTGLSASTGGQDRINIAWTDTSDSEAGFTVQRQAEGSTSWQQAGSVPANANSFADTGLSAGTLYRYRVNAFNATGTSAYSSIVSAETEAGSVSGGATGIDVQASGYKIKGRQNAAISWSGATSTNVDIYRNGTKIATPKNSGGYTDNIGLKGGGSYSYKVCEVNTSACSSPAGVSF